MVTRDAKSKAGNSIAFVKSRLERFPRERLEAVAIRAALRVLPLVAGLGSYVVLSEDKLLPIYLFALRTGHASWANLRYPQSLSDNSLLAAARALSRITDSAAGNAGDIRYSKSSDAIVDAAIGQARKDIDFQLRSLTASLQAANFIDGGVADSVLQEIVIDTERLLSPETRAFKASQVLTSQKLWGSARPSWHQLWTNRFFRDLEALGEQSFWRGWYDARQRGNNEFDFDHATVEGLNLEVVRRRQDFWLHNPVQISKELEDIVRKYKSTAIEKPKTIAELAFEIISNSDGAVSIHHILGSFAKASFPVVQKTLRGELSRLAASGRIVRVGPGMYAAEQPRVLRVPVNLEPQTQGAIQFELEQNDLIRVRRRGSAGELRSDEFSRRRHAEVCRRVDELLKSYGRSAKGGNTSAILIEDVELLKESIGVDIESVDPDLMVPRGDGLRNDLAAYEARDDFSDLPPIPDALLLSLKKVISAYNNFVAFDPELVRRDEALLGPDAKKKLVPPEDGQRVIRNAVLLEAAVPEVVEVLGEDARVAPALPDPDSRQSRRYSEGAKNFARVAVEKALDFASLVWSNKIAIGSGAATVVVSGVGAAKWVVENQLWLLKYFSENQTMVAIIRDLVRFLSNLPLA